MKNIFTLIKINLKRVDNFFIFYLENFESSNMIYENKIKIPMDTIEMPLFLNEDGGNSENGEKFDFFWKKKREKFGDFFKIEKVDHFSLCYKYDDNILNKNIGEEKNLPILDLGRNNENIDFCGKERNAENLNLFNIENKDNNYKKPLYLTKYLLKLGGMSNGYNKITRKNKDFFNNKNNNNNDANTGLPESGQFISGFHGISFNEKFNCKNTNSNNITIINKNINKNFKENTKNSILLNRKIKRIKYKENSKEEKEKEKIIRANNTFNNKNNNKTDDQQEGNSSVLQVNPNISPKTKIAETHLSDILNFYLKDFTNFNLPFYMLEILQTFFTNLRITYFQDITNYKDNFLSDISDQECLKMYLDYA